MKLLLKFQITDLVYRYQIKSEYLKDFIEQTQLALEIQMSLIKVKAVDLDYQLLMR